MTSNYQSLAVTCRPALTRLLLVCLEDGVSAVVLHGRQINSVGERGVECNFVLGNFLTYRFNKVKSSENHLLQFFSEVLKENILSKIPQELHTPFQTKLFHASTPC